MAGTVIKISWENYGAHNRNKDLLQKYPSNPNYKTLTTATLTGNLLHYIQQLWVIRATITTISLFHKNTTPINAPFMVPLYVFYFWHLYHRIVWRYWYFHYYEFTKENIGSNLSHKTYTKNPKYQRTKPISKSSKLIKKYYLFIEESWKYFVN